MLVACRPRAGRPVRSHPARRARTWPLGPPSDRLLTGNAHARCHRLHRRAEPGATLPLGLLKRRQNGGGGRRERARELSAPSSWKIHRGAPSTAQPAPSNASATNGEPWPGYDQWRASWIAWHVGLRDQTFAERVASSRPFLPPGATGLAAGGAIHPSGGAGAVQPRAAGPTPTGPASLALARDRRAHHLPDPAADQRSRARRDDHAGGRGTDRGDLARRRACRLSRRQPLSASRNARRGVRRTSSPSGETSSRGSDPKPSKGFSQQPRRGPRAPAP